MPEDVSEEQSPFPSEAAKSILARAPESNQSLQRQLQQSYFGSSHSKLQKHTARVFLMYPVQLHTK